MSRIVHLRHPAPVRYVPRRGRHERLSFEMAETPVELAEVSTGELRVAGRIGIPRDGKVGEMFGSRDLHERDGLLWTPLLDERRRPITPEALVEFMEGGLPGWDRTDLKDALSATPLLVPRAELAGEHDREAHFSRGSVGTMVHDGAERATADAAAFVASNLLACDGKAFVRVPGLLAYRHHKFDGPVYVANALPRSARMPAFHCRADRLDAHWAHLIATGSEKASKAGMRPELVGVHGLEGHVPSNDHVMIAANMLPEHARDAVARLGWYGGDGKAVLAATAEMRAEMRQHETVAALGSLSAAEAVTVMRLSLEMAEAGLAATQKGDRHMAESLSRHLREHLLPCVAPPSDERDADAFVGLVA